MWRHRPPILIAILIALILGIASCGQDDSISEPTAGPRAPQGLIDKDGTAPSAENQAYLGWIYHQPEVASYTYEVALTGVVSVANGGLLTGTPASWPSGYVFSYLVFEDAIDLAASGLDPDTDEVEITMLVPVADSQFPCPDAAMPIQLKPDGLVYKSGQPAQATLCYHPNLEPNYNAGYWWHSAEPDPATGFYVAMEIYQTYTTPTYNVLDKGLGGPVIIEPSPRPYECEINIPAAIGHHSTWALEKNGGGPTPPDSDDLVDPCCEPE